MGHLGWGGEILKSSNLGEEGWEEVEEEEVVPFPHPNLTLCFGSLDKSLPCSAHWTHFNSDPTMIFFFLQSHAGEMRWATKGRLKKTNRKKEEKKTDVLTNSIQTRLYIWCSLKAIQRYRQFLHWPRQNMMQSLLFIHLRTAILILKSNTGEKKQLIFALCRNV